MEESMAAPLPAKKDAGSHLVVGTPRQLADDGTLSRFIERDGIHFDTASLTIHISTK